MTLYCFERVADGCPVEVDYPMGSAPPVGEVVDVHGHGPCRRVYAWESGASVERDVAHVAWQMPPWIPGAPRYVEDPKNPAYGQPLFLSKAEIERFEKENPEWQHGAAPATAERRYRDESRTYSRRLTWAVSEGPGKMVRGRRRGRPKKGRA